MKMSVIFSQRFKLCTYESNIELFTYVEGLFMTDKIAI